MRVGSRHHVIRGCAYGSGRAGDLGRPALRFFLLDFRQVSGIDSSATLSLARARQLAEKQGFVLGLCRVPPAVLGELGLFLGVPRTASVVVELPSVVHRLSFESLQRLKTEEPEVSADFHEFLVRYMAERIVTCNKTIRALAE